MSAGDSSLLVGYAPLRGEGTSPGLLSRVWRQAKRHPRVAWFAGFLIVIWLVSLAAPVIAPYNPYAVNTHNLYQPPSWTHLAGTDDLGRDTLSRVIYGGRLSLLVAAIVVAI